MKHTLKKNHEFRRLYHKGASAVGQGMVVYARRNNLGKNRVGFTVSVKLGHAVVRNRMRRRLRETYRLALPNMKSGWDIVVVARSRCFAMPWNELQRTFLHLCKKVDVMKDENVG